ncbi:hypothetical protein V8E36_009361 [Tilletia maclaganii]
MHLPAALSTGLVNATVSMASDSKIFGASHHFLQHGSHRYSIPLHRHLPPTAVGATSDADVHAYVQAHVIRITAKYNRYFDLFRKTTGVRHHLDRRTGESLSYEGMPGRMRLSDVRDGALWVGLLDVGTGLGRVQLTANFDTGSIDSVINLQGSAERCLPSPAEPKQNPGLYDPAASKTAKFTGETFEVEYSDGTTLEGDIILDHVTAAGLEAHSVAIGNAIRSTVNAEDCQAIVGMEPMVPRIHSALYRSGFMSALVEQNLVSRHLFGFGLWLDNSARLDLGHIPLQYRGQISWTPVISPENGMWACAFDISNVREAQIALVDTDTLLIPCLRALPSTAAGMIIREEDGLLYGAYYTSGPTPQISITIAGRPFALSAQALAFKYDGDMTIAGIMGKTDVEVNWYLGDVFLQNVYAVFDADLQRIGFAPRQQPRTASWDI